MMISQQIEYVMWGLPKHSTERYDEVLLLSKELASKDGFHSFRIAAIDLSKAPDFTGAAQ